MAAPIGGAFHAVCIIAPGDQIAAARQGAWEFHIQDSPHFADPLEKMLTAPLSPSGSAPVTHFICTRHDTLEALGRIETYQQKLDAAGRSRVPVTLYISDNEIGPEADQIKSGLAAHEASVLTQLGLRKIT